MSDITKSPTADLIAEWKNKENVYVDEEDYRDEMGEPIENAAQLYADADAALDAHWIAISAELDRRADSAGIWIGDGLPTFTKFDDYEIPQPEKDYLPHLESVTIDIQPAELHALLGWLLLKEGGNG